MKARKADSVETSAEVVGAWRHDPAFVTIIVLAGIAWFSALGLIIVKWPFVLHKFVIPLAVSLYRPGHVPSAEGVEEFLGMLAYEAVMVGGLALGYACLWHYLLRRLPAGAPSMHVPSTPSLSTLEICCLAAIGVLAVILRLQRMTLGLRLDEVVTTIRFVDQSLWTTLSTDDLFNNHLAHSFLANLTQQLFGRSEWALRLPALLLGLTSLYVLWAFTRRLAGPALAVLATAGLAVSPAHIFFSTQSRGYAGMLLFSLVSTSLYWQILHRPSWGKGLLFTLANVLAIFFQLYAALVVLTQLLFLLYLAVREMATGRSGRFLSVDSCRILYLAFPAIVGMSFARYALVVPHYVAQLHQLGHPAFDLSFPLRVLVLLSWGPARSESLEDWELVVVTGGLCIVGWIALRQRCARVADYWAFMGIFPLLIYMSTRPYYWPTRFLFFLLPFYLTLVAGGLLAAWQAASTQTKRVSRTVLQACCLLTGVAILGAWLVSVWVDFPHLSHGFREAARAMEEETVPEAGLCAFGSGGWTLQYYVKRDLFIPHNREDFDQFVSRYSSITCAFMSVVEVEPAYVRDIRSFLAQHAASRPIQDIVVYTYRK